MPDPAKAKAEGQAVGGACRHAGRGLEDCFKLNPRADKASVYEGWKEMNEYMAKNNMQAVPPSLAAEPTKKGAASEAHDDGAGAAEKADTHAQDDEGAKDEAKAATDKEEHGEKAAKGGH